jgi:exodeoxyribonuclease-1
MLIKLTPDILPDPEAVLLTGITPQQTFADGLSEADFLRYFFDHIVQPDTIFLGYNSVRFDDEFMRYLLYRNFYDAYEWQWTNGCSRWDILDAIRMTRALRPEGIVWPVTPEGKASNRLELMTRENGLAHDQAHDALSDVSATIGLAKLLLTRQPALFRYLLEHHTKKAAKEIVAGGKPFVYTSGRYPSETLHTTVAVLLGQHPTTDSALVYDLRYDPTPFLGMSVDQLLESWRFSKDPGHRRLPVKTLKYNRCPAVAPLGVMSDDASQERLQLPLTVVGAHLAILKKQLPAFTDKVMQALSTLDSEQAEQQAKATDSDVETRLYDGFFDTDDKTAMRIIRSLSPAELGATDTRFHDSRLGALLPHYKARNYPEALTAEERQTWDDYLKQKFLKGGNNSPLALYFKRLYELAQTPAAVDKRYLLEELQLYGEAIAPADAID